MPLNELAVLADDAGSVVVARLLPLGRQVVVRNRGTLLVGLPDHDVVDDDFLHLLVLALSNVTPRVPHEQRVAAPIVAASPNRAGRLRR